MIGVHAKSKVNNEHLHFKPSLNRLWLEHMLLNCEVLCSNPVIDAANFLEHEFHHALLHYTPV